MGSGLTNDPKLFEHDSVTTSDPSAAVPRPRMRVALKGGVSVGGSSNYLITNLSISATTETSHALQADVKKVLIRARGNSKLQLSFTSGQSNVTYVTISRGTAMELNDIEFASETLYLYSSGVDTVEILELY